MPAIGRRPACCQRAHGQLAPDESDAQHQPRHDHPERRRRCDRQCQHDGQPTRGGVQVVAGAGDIERGFAGRGQRVADGFADQGDVVGAMPGRLQAVGDAVGAALDLTAHVSDRRDRAVHGQADECPHERPDHDHGVAEQLSQQPARCVGVRDKPRVHTADPSTRSVGGSAIRRQLRSMAGSLSGPSGPHRRPATFVCRAPQRAFGPASSSGYV